MKFTKQEAPTPQIDAIAAEDDMVDIRLYEPNGPGNGQTLCVDVNGITVLRIGHLKQEVELARE